MSQGPTFFGPALATQEKCRRRLGRRIVIAQKALPRREGLPATHPGAAVVDRLTRFCFLAA